jgi:endonuclease/exonuclease/phosphatase (EEP) superfamily protein YafD
MTRTSRSIAVLCVAGLLAGRLNVVWPVLDIVSQFTTHFFLVLVAIAGACILRRGAAWFSLAILCVLLVAYGSWPMMDRRYLTSDVHVPGSIRIGTFSTLGPNKDLSALYAEIRRLDPDIMTLLEVWPDKRPLLDRLKGQYPYIHSCETVPNCHLAIISKHPFVATRHKGNWDGPPQILAVFGPELASLTVVGVHMSRFPVQALQQQQADALTADLLTHSGNLLLTGDFNATPYSVIPSRIEAARGLRRQTFIPSWPAQFGLPQFAIDHIFLSAGLKPASSPIMGRYAGSDHLPVLIDLLLPGT